MSEYWQAIENLPTLQVAVWCVVVLLFLIWLRLGILHYLPDTTNMQAEFAEIKVANRRLLEQLEELGRKIDKLGDTIEFRLPSQLGLSDVPHLLKDGATSTEKAIDELRTTLEYSINRLRADLSHSREGM